MRELSQPLTIEERIRVAIGDDDQRHVIYYRRMEGATTAAQRIAENDKQVVILSGHHCKRECEEKGIRYLDYNSRPDVREIHNSIIIADVVPVHKMEAWKSLLYHQLGNKIIELRGVH